MKKTIISLSAIVLVCTSLHAGTPAIPRDPAIEQKVEATLSRLTLRQKAGQMVELVIDLFGKNDANGVFHIDKARTDSILRHYQIGSILNAPNTMAPTARQWQEYLRDIQESSMRIIGIPCLFGLDQNHGSTYTQGGTLFPLEHQCGSNIQPCYCSRLRGSDSL